MTSYIYWQEPLGNGKYAYECKARKEDVIKYMKEEWQLQFKDHPNYPYKSDIEALDDFIAIHWAYEVNAD